MVSIPPGRFVAILFGPPCAGKTTIAQAAGLRVYDRDDDEWFGSEARFHRAISALNHDAGARAVVIRTGSTESARTGHRRTIGATHAWMVWVEQDEAQRRAKLRARDPKDHVAIANWYARYDQGRDVQTWPGSWAAALTLSEISRSW